MKFANYQDLLKVWSPAYHLVSFKNQEEEEKFLLSNRHVARLMPAWEPVLSEGLPVSGPAYAGSPAGLLGPLPGPHAGPCRLACWPPRALARPPRRLVPVPVPARTGSQPALCPAYAGLPAGSPARI